MSELRKVRTTLDPTKELEVSEAEYQDLKYQGLLCNAKGEPVEKKESK